MFSEPLSDLVAKSRSFRGLFATEPEKCAQKANPRYAGGSRAVDPTPELLRGLRGDEDRAPGV